MPIDVEALRHIPLFAQLGQEELMHQGRAVVVNPERLRVLS